MKRGERTEYRVCWDENQNHEGFYEDREPGIKTKIMKGFMRTEYRVSWDKNQNHEGFHEDRVPGILG